MGFCYMLQYTDKVTLGYSTQLGLREDLVRHPPTLHSTKLTPLPETTWHRIQLVQLSILFRISRVVLAIILPRRALSIGEVPRSFGSSLGCCSHVPWCNA
jgi:hypothetical protein